MGELNLPFLEDYYFFAFMKSRFAAGFTWIESCDMAVKIIELGGWTVENKASKPVRNCLSFELISLMYDGCHRRFRILDCSREKWG